MQMDMERSVQQRRTAIFVRLKNSANMKGMYEEIIMELVKSLEEIRHNMATLDSYLNKKDRPGVLIFSWPCKKRNMFRCR